MAGASKELGYRSIAFFCDSLAMMLAAGIGADEAAGLLCEDSAQNDFHDAAKSLYDQLLPGGMALGDAMQNSGFFPAYACRMVQIGEKAGRTEQVLRSLGRYYHSQDALQQKLKSALLYPLVLLCVMALVLLVLLARVLPVFTGVYAGLAGSLAASSYGYITVAYAVGGTALFVSAVLAAALAGIAIAARYPKPRAALLHLAQRLPLTAPLCTALAVARFTEVLALFTASGMDEESTLTTAAELTGDPTLRRKSEVCLAAMQGEGKGLAAALFDANVLEPLYGRMLVCGARTGALEDVLDTLAAQFSDAAEERVDSLIGAAEPALSLFLTVAVGLTLLSVMLPLVGILGAIG